MGVLRDVIQLATKVRIPGVIPPKALPIVSTVWSLQPIHRRSELDLEAIRKYIWYDVNLQKTIRDVAKPFKHKPVPKSLEETREKSVNNPNSGT